MKKKLMMVGGQSAIIVGSCASWISMVMECVVVVKC